MTALLLTLSAPVLFGSWLSIQLLRERRSAGQLRCPCCHESNTVQLPACGCCGGHNVLLGATSSPASGALDTDNVLFLACRECEPVTLHLLRCGKCDRDLTDVAAGLYISPSAKPVSASRLTTAVLETLATETHPATPMTHALVA